ncbi:hypothetical protein CBP36_21045 (plasmid) [Acidovorax carolinensis]|uniref:Uncharacterized protein n=1 Tax=Acidovorax carolinensis TaxID=553814 RepID=A0A240UIY0_9BURK|nr:hypothetical protein [Acidovorax carolinensis]ART61457.1 hypothetical protein CBP36_21045 [Acidovorax carolinensis]
MKKKSPGVFKKVSEWIAAGNMRTGFYSLERVERETDKAVGFKAEKYTASGNLKSAICWIPKSKLQTVVNDYYIHGPAQMFLVPAWLYSAKVDEGFVL